MTQAEGGVQAGVDRREGKGESLARQACWAKLSPSRPVTGAVRLARGDRGPAGRGKAVPHAAGRWSRKACGRPRSSAAVAARRARICA